MRKLITLLLLAALPSCQTAIDGAMDRLDQSIAKLPTVAAEAAEKATDAATEKLNKKVVAPVLETVKPTLEKVDALVETSTETIASVKELPKKVADGVNARVESKLEDLSNRALDPDQKRDFDRIADEDGIGEAAKKYWLELLLTALGLKGGLLWRVLVERKKKVIAETTAHHTVTAVQREGSQEVKSRVDKRLRGTKLEADVRQFIDTIKNRG